MNAAIASTGLTPGAATSDENKGAGNERSSLVRVKHGSVTFEIGYWDEALNRARTDDEIAAIANALCALRAQGKQ